MGTMTASGTVFASRPDAIALVVQEVATPFEIAARPRPQKPLKLAYISLVIFFVLYFARPDDWIPALQSFSIVRIAGAIALFAFLKDFRTQPLAKEGKVLFLLFFQMCLSIPFGLWRGGSFEMVVNRFSKIVLITFLLMMAVNTMKRLRWLLFIHAFCVIALCFFSMGSIYGGRIYGRLGGVFENPNDLALAVNVTLPLCLAFLLASRNLLKKCLWGGAMVLLLYILVATLSRSGFLSISAALLVLTWLYGIKDRRAGILLLIFIAILTPIIVAPEAYSQRLKSIFDPTLDTGSSKVRRELLAKSLKVTVENPFLGIGPGNFEQVSGNWQVTHNAYTELSAEAGIPALALFLLLMYCAFSNVAKIRALGPSDRESRIFANALCASLAAFSVGAFFASMAYHFYPYFLVGYTTVLYRIASAGKAARAASVVPTPSSVSPAAAENLTVVR